MPAKYVQTETPLGIMELGSTYMTELAKSQQQLQDDPLAFLLPQRTIPKKEVEIRVKGGSLRVTGIVNPGEPNGLNKYESWTKTNYQAANFRRGGFVDMDTLNYLASEDDGEKAYGMELVSDGLNELIEQGNRMLTVLRAQLLNGGINLKDYETGNSVIMPSGIPITHSYTVGTTEPLTAAYGDATTWDDVSADIIDQLNRIKRRCFIAGQAMPDTMLVNGAVQTLFSRNTKILAIQQGEGAGDVRHFVTFDENGNLSKICGLRVITCDTVYDEDQADGTLKRKYILPINRAILLTAKQPTQNHPLGYTVLTKGENPFGGTGPWVRTFGVDRGGPQEAPGVGYQFGMAGIPVLYNPKWVHHLTISTEAKIAAIVGKEYTNVA